MFIIIENWRKAVRVQGGPVQYIEDTNDGWQVDAFLFVVKKSKITYTRDSADSVDWAWRIIKILANFDRFIVIRADFRGMDEIIAIVTFILSTFWPTLAETIAGASAIEGLVHSRPHVTHVIHFGDTSKALWYYEESITSVKRLNF